MAAQVFQLGRAGAVDRGPGAVPERIDRRRPGDRLDAVVLVRRQGDHGGAKAFGKLLGHTQVQTTARYAHLAADPVKRAANTVSGEIADMLGGKAAYAAKPDA